MKNLFLELTDTHCHLNSFNSEKINAVVIGAKEFGVKRVFDVSVDFESIVKSIEISKSFPDFVYSFIGIDPDIYISTDLNSDVLNFDNLESELEKYIEKDRKYIVGIGETGIDLYTNEKLLKLGKINENQFKKSRDRQVELFERHLKIAEKYNLPLTIHSRGAERLCLEIVNNFNVKGVFHSYTGELEIAKKIIKNGFHLGVNGIFTFKNASELRVLYQNILPKITGDEDVEWFFDRGIVFETDSPYLAPEGIRGSVNEPKNVVQIFKFFRDYLANKI